MNPDPSKFNRIIIFAFSLFLPGLLSGQPQIGKVLSQKTNMPIGYVNIGISGKNIGTVSDMSGNFSIILDNIYDNDSLRFSMIGYDSESILVRQFKEDSVKNVYLAPKLYNLQEVIVISRKRKTKEVVIGTPVFSDVLRSGFASNNLGSEMGIKVNVRGRVLLKDINLNVATCTFDSVTYRLNIYQFVNQTEYKNILTEPIYISFSKDKINNVITFDLTRYSIFIKDNVLIALELYKDLGEGRLLFHTQFFTGSTFHRKTSEGNWTQASGVIGLYLHGLLLK